MKYTNRAKRVWFLIKFSQINLFEYRHYDWQQLTLKPLHICISRRKNVHFLKVPLDTTDKRLSICVTLYYIISLEHKNWQRVEQNTHARAHFRPLRIETCCIFISTISRHSHRLYKLFLHNRFSKRLEVIVVVIVRAQRPQGLWSHGGDGADRLYVADRLDPSVLLLLLARRPRRGGRRRRRQTVRLGLGQEGRRLRSRRRQGTFGGGRLVVVVELVLLPLQLLFHTQPQRPAQGALKSRTQFLIGSPAFLINACLRQRCGATQFIQKLHKKYPFVYQSIGGNPDRRGSEYRCHSRQLWQTALKNQVRDRDNNEMGKIFSRDRKIEPDNNCGCLCVPGNCAGKI